MQNTLSIGSRTYTIEGTRTVVNNFGQTQVWTDLKGSRGADVVLCETQCEYGVVAKLIHFGRMKPAESVDASLIRRA